MYSHHGQLPGALWGCRDCRYYQGSSCFRRESSWDQSHWHRQHWGMWSWDFSLHGWVSFQFDSCFTPLSAQRYRSLFSSNCRGWKLVSRRTLLQLFQRMTATSSNFIGPWKGSSNSTVFLSNESQCQCLNPFHVLSPPRLHWFNFLTLRDPALVKEVLTSVAGCWPWFQWDENSWILTEQRNFLVWEDTQALLWIVQQHGLTAWLK